MNKYLVISILLLTVFACKPAERQRGRVVVEGNRSLPDSLRQNSNIKSYYLSDMKKYRSEYLEKFKQNPNSPLQEDQLKGIQFFEVDEAYHISGTFTPTPSEASFMMPTYAGKSQEYRQYGIFEGILGADTIRLGVYQSLFWLRMDKHKEHLFIPFKDSTNGSTTYEGGRYIDASINDIENGRLTLDFNKCYNPYCAYADGYACPIPPKKNHLSFPILAGEKKYSKE